MSELLEMARKELESKFVGSGFGNSVKFVIEGEGSVHATNEAVTISDDEADLTLTASADVFQEVISGEMSGASAFMSGKLKVDGNMGLAMQLGSVLG